MRRTLGTWALVLLAGGAAVAPAHAASKPALSAKLTECTTAADAAGRAASFTGSMPAIVGARRLWMSFSLLQRRGGTGAFARVDVPGWKDWVRSDAGRPGFVYTKRIESLLAPAAYRAQIRFRWYDRRGRLLRQDLRTTGTCVQPDPRPDLWLARLAGHVGDPGEAVYELTIGNRGVGAAGLFEVVLSVGGRELAPVQVGPLAPGLADLATVTGPRCAAGSTVTVRLDAGKAVDEAREDDDVLTRPCPL